MAMDGGDARRSTESSINLRGTAARTRIRDYRPNTGDRDRSLKGLLNWAAECGVVVPDYATVEVDKGFQPTRNGLPAEAKYYEFQGAFPDELIYWHSRTNRRRSILDERLSAVVINLAPDVPSNDERFVHVLAHEVFELTALKELFDHSNGSMSAARLYELTEPLSTLRNLHWFAWEQADRLIERLREVSK